MGDQLLRMLFQAIQRHTGVGHQSPFAKMDHNAVHSGGETLAGDGLEVVRPCQLKPPGTSLVDQRLGQWVFRSALRGKRPTPIAPLPRPH